MWNRPRASAFVALAVLLLVSRPWEHHRRHQQAVQPVRPAVRQSICVVSIPLEAGLEITPVIAGGAPGKYENFREMVGRLHPLVAAINGTYYDEHWRPLGDVVIDGKLVNRGHYPNAIALRNDGRVSFVRSKGKPFNWSGYRAALAAGPMLVRGGKVSLDPNADGFRLNALKIKAPRSGVGLSRTSLILVVCRDRVTLKQFAEIMIRAGAREAMNLDGGPACGLYHHGRVVEDAAIPMTNILTVRRVPCAPHK